MDEETRPLGSRQPQPILDLLPPPDTPAEEDPLLASLTNDLDVRILHRRNQAQPNPDKDFGMPYPLTTSRNSISSAKFEHVASLPAYPKTHPYGYTYVVNLEGLAREQAEAAMAEVQYSRSLSRTDSNVMCSYLETRCIKRTYKCSGIKICKWLHEDLRGLKHSSVDSDLVYTITQIRKELQKADTLTKPQRESLGGGTSNLTTDDTATHHFHKSLIRQEKFDIDLLAHLVANPASFEEDYASLRCGVAESTKTRKQACGNIHPQGDGELVRETCGVRFITYIPVDLNQQHKALFWSQGIVEPLGISFALTSAFTYPFAITYPPSISQSRPNKVQRLASTNHFQQDQQKDNVSYADELQMANLRLQLAQRELELQRREIELQERKRAAEIRKLQDEITIRKLRAELASSHN
ncbi:uncharacterized protein N7515_000802 [Penicillium bovifimosum]|uniref:Uncharacterized protein n=1 Tax=Penicillium bovifimosum TaxID=126998 RepID=A0A9W9HG84_9EURO|nr:uncharacterized protein N7515_000802 [Penicillium bovifimosum]KAJ5146238.1 hypothetical protein N7515_000802 [Penicillium bovifimosum]